MNFLAEISIPTWVCLVASVGSLLYVNRLSLLDILATSVLWINLVVDLYATYLITEHESTVFIYNVSLPILSILVLFIYYKFSPVKWLSIAYQVALTLVIILWAYYDFGFGIYNTFHYEPYVVSSFIITAASYFLMRTMVLKMVLLPPVILFFSLANFAYYALGLASQYAEIYKDALSDRQSYIVKVYVNDVGYILSSLMILTGIIWKNKRDLRPSL